MVPATCVACPDSEVGVGMHGATPVSSSPLLARPPKSVCDVRTPVSMTYACTPVPSEPYEYWLSSGRLVWSRRSIPHDGVGDSVVSMLTTEFSSTAATAGSAASCCASASLISTAKPCSVSGYRSSTRPWWPCESCAA